MDNGKRTTSAAKGPGEPLRPAGRTARTGSGQHDAVPCLLGHDVPVRHLDGLVYRLAGAVWQQSICWVFILLSGFCVPLGHRTLKRGAQVFAAGALVTVVTLVFMPEDRVVFGVLTFLGSAMLLTGVLEPLLKKIPPAAGLAVSAVLFALTYHLDERWLGFGGLRLALPDAWYANYFTAFFGFLPFDFYSTDYFALLPWLFLFWAGYFLHGVVGRARMEPLRRSVCPALGWMGRHSLLLYLLHQPVIYGVLSAAAVLFA